MWRGNIAVLQEQRQAVDIDIPNETRMGIQRLQLRTEQQQVRRTIIIERLHPGPVPDQDQLALRPVIYGKRKHPDEPLHHIDTPTVIPLQDNLRVRPGLESIPLALQLLSDLLEIIDFTVEIDDQITEMHRLMTKRGKVEDR